MHHNSSCVHTANLYAKQWRKPENRSEELPPRVFHIQPNSGIFGEYYDEVQELLKSMAGMDEFLQFNWHYADTMKGTYVRTCMFIKCKPHCLQ